MENCCKGCGREEPCGVHYDDCKYLEVGDYIIPRIDAGTEKDHEQYAQLLSL